MLMQSKDAAPDTPKLAGAILAEAASRSASDIHIEPTQAGHDVRYRIDGLLASTQQLTGGQGRSLVTRLMVMAQLLTYRLDVPQEGRITVSLPGFDTPLTLRLAIMPTTHGLRAVVRLPAELNQPRMLSALNLPQPTLDALHRFAREEAGMLLVTGPAGSGKTTTIYALLEHIGRTSPGASIIALEDPVERDLRGVTQIQVQPFGELTYERALRSILRQDPQVLMLGEIRDAQTASLAIQAALTGHRLIATLHAGTPGGAIARLLEMGIEPYQVTSTLFAVVTQRLVRGVDEQGRYAGRLPVAEILTSDAALRQAILDRTDASTLNQQVRFTMRDAAAALIDAKRTDQAEINRVLGPRENS
jgi:type II secretory ATPase GspE/PulE/Tfp pilus assembly ATPase PilB-like protein